MFQLPITSYLTKTCIVSNPLYQPNNDKDEKGKEKCTNKYTIVWQRYIDKIPAHGCFAFRHLHTHLAFALHAEVHVQHPYFLHNHFEVPPNLYPNQYPFPVEKRGKLSLQVNQVMQDEQTYRSSSKSTASNINESQIKSNNSHYKGKVS